MAEPSQVIEATPSKANGAGQEQVPATHAAVPIELVSELIDLIADDTYKRKQKAIRDLTQAPGLNAQQVKAPE